jgi:cyclopropane-fatty-acyl-phospholipid synthase
MFGPLRFILARVVRDGGLKVYDADGRAWTYGPARPPTVTIRIADKPTERALARDPNLAIAEAYMDGRLAVLQGTIYDLISMLMRGAEARPLPAWARAFDEARWRMRRLAQFNPASRSRSNVAHHYDIDGSIYDLFLDADRQYSCAYFAPQIAEPSDLEEAQRLKKQHIAAKLALQPGHRVLDIGCGWGGLGLYLARLCEAKVKGVTLSQEQIAIARRRVMAAGLEHAVELDLIDYRALEGRFDRIVSVGMFEHVGLNHFGAFFGKVRSLLAEDGVALIHTIGRSDGPGFTNPFIAKYIFPGGYFPALSEMLPAIEKAGLVVTDVEVLRLHYAQTLKAWRERFMERRGEAVALRGEAFARMWEFYLAGSEAAFRHQGLVVFQVQLARSIDALPTTRDYIQTAERRLELRDRARIEPRMAGE